MTDLETRLKECWRTNRTLVADTTASLTFGFTVSAFNELYIAGLSFEQMIKSRALGTIINVASGRPYGKYRDWLLDKLDVTHESPQWKKMTADALAYVSFGVPLYAGILYSTGAKTEQIVTGCASLGVLLVALGKPYGWYLDKTRHLFGADRAEAQE